MNSEEFAPELSETTAIMSDAYPELEKLKAANEALREEGKEWLLTTLENISDELNRTLTPTTEPPTAPVLQIGGQDWQFEVEKNVMVGERLGIRYRGQTLVIEVGWPRTPEHGIVPDLGLARARVSFSQNVMIDPILLDELTLRRSPNGEGVVWVVLADRTLREQVTDEKLRGYVHRTTTE